jgi:UDP-N-acetylmuramoyl-tripeptide--D-alanyl-D-alanine ligase
VRLRIRSLRDIPPLLASYAGRERIISEAGLRLWPFVAPLAQGYRRTVLGRTPVVVVVGSQGKSTTVRALYGALGLDPHAWVDSNAGAEIAFNLFRGRPSDKAVVLEVGIGARGQMESYATHLRPTTVVVTSVGTEHHGSLGSKVEIRSEKARMVECVPRSGAVFLNADDEHVLWMGQRTRAERVTFGLSATAAVRATDLRLDWPEGIAFKLHIDGRTRSTRTRFLSKDLVRAFLAAAAVAVRLGEPLDAVLDRLESVAPTPRRLEPRRLDNGACVLRDEYKSSLETIDSALDVMEELTIPGRRFVVLGEVSEPPGSQGPIYRRIGERVAGVAHAAVFVGGNFQRYAAGARRAGMAADSLIDAGRSWQAAADYLRGVLREGDVVLVKGRDTQRLDRISLSLLGREVRCALTECELLDCEGCPMLARETPAPGTARSAAMLPLAGPVSPR